MSPKKPPAVYCKYKVGTQRVMAFHIGKVRSFLLPPIPHPAATKTTQTWPGPEPTKVNGKMPKDFSEEGSISSGKCGRERFGQGYDFTVCVHRMSPFPHGGTLATLPTFLVLSVQHCTWSYLPFTSELI